MMFRKLSEHRAARALILFFSLFILFHVAVLAGFVPMELVWGGRLKTREELVRFEVVSIVLNVLMLMAAMAKAKFLKQGSSPRWLMIIFWAMTTLFALNTLGNLLAESYVEKMVFTPVTLLLSVLSARLALRSS